MASNSLARENGQLRESLAASVKLGFATRDSFKQLTEEKERLQQELAALRAAAGPIRSDRGSTSVSSSS